MSTSTTPLVVQLPLLRLRQAVLLHLLYQRPGGKEKGTTRQLRLSVNATKLDSSAKTASGTFISGVATILTTWGRTNAGRGANIACVHKRPHPELRVRSYGSMY